MAPESSDGRAISRREVLRRGAVIGGVLWAAPAIQSFTNAAAAGSPPPEPDDEGPDSDGPGGGGDQGGPGVGGPPDDSTTVLPDRAVQDAPEPRGGDEPSVLADRLARTAQDPRAIGAFGVLLSAIGAAIRRLSRSTGTPDA